MKYIITTKVDENKITGNVSIGNIYTETYRRDEAEPIMNYVNEFMNWLEIYKLDGLYKEKWVAKDVRED